MSANKSRVSRLFSLFHKGPKATCDFCDAFGRPDSVEQFRNDLARSSLSCQTCRILFAGFELKFFDIVRSYNGPVYIYFPERYPELGLKDWTLKVVGRGESQLHEEFFFFTKNIVPQNKLQVSQPRPSLAVPPPQPLIHKDSGSIEALDSVKFWVERCNETHSNCVDHANDSIIPRRVIDVRSQVPRLFISENQKGKYITLSHCWGGVRHCVTEKDNLEQRCQGIELLDMPKSFQDAICLTRHLGISFLWIDSLCIIQDDRDDWFVESAKMCDIYSKSYLTIAASRAPDSHAGFFSPRDAWQVGHRLQGIPGVMVRQTMHVRFSEPDPLITRAWTLQEMALSGRVISYTKNDIAWRCLTETTCECGSGGFDYSGADNISGTGIGRIPVENTDIPAGDNDSSELDLESTLPHYWRKMIQIYTSRCITKQSDRLPALSGIAEKFKFNKRGRYLAGIWENDFPYALAWYICEGKMTDIYIAPSWSWASVSGEVKYDTWSRSSKEYPDSNDYPSQWCKVTESSTTPVWNDTGEVTEGYINVYGQIIEAELEMIASSPPEYNMYVPRKSGGSIDGFDGVEEGNYKDTPLRNRNYSTDSVNSRDGFDDVEGDIYIDTPLRNCTYSTDYANSRTPTMKTFCRSSVESVGREDLLPANDSSRGDVLLLLIKMQFAAKRNLHPYYLILVPSTKYKGAYERIGLLLGFLPGGSGVWRRIWSKEEKVVALTNYEERTLYLKSQISLGKYEEDFDWDRYLPHWRNITII